MTKMPPKTRLKSAAQLAAPQTREACAEEINRVGRLQRDILRLQAAMNDEIAAVTDAYKGQFEPLKEELSIAQQGVQTWCEAHRDEITEGGKSKSAQFVTGAVQWRQRPPSVAARGVEAVIETLKRLGLARFVRVKEELNKEAILNEPEAVKGVAGITLNVGVEDFVITPFEQEAA